LERPALGEEQQQVRPHDDGERFRLGQHPMKPQALLKPPFSGDVYHPPSLRRVAVSDEVEAKVSAIELALVNEATCGLE
jgi:hypothetical protein